MTKRPQAPTRRVSAADAASAALILLAERALDVHFSDIDNRETYEFLFPPGMTRRNRAAAGATAPLDFWQMGAGGTLVLMATPDKDGFAVVIDRKPVTAIVTATYDFHRCALKKAEIGQLVGAKTAALALALAWTEELIRGDSLDPDDATAGPDDQEAPGQPTAEDAETVRRIAASLAPVLKRAGPGVADAVDLEWLDDNPQSLWPILDGLVAAFRGDRARIDAYRWLLAMQLEHIRYRQEAGWEWASRMLDAYQDRLLTLSQDSGIAQTDLLQLATALGQAKIAVRPEVSAAMMAGADEPADSVAGADPLEGLRVVFDQLADTVRNPFELIEATTEVIGATPADLRAFLVHEFARSAHPLMRDAVALMLLDDAAVIRQTAIAALAQMVTLGTLSPAALRRTIAVRNWLPETDRVGVDRVIRAAREKGVDCAPWPPFPELTVFASAIDGSGAQSLIVTTRSVGAGLFAGVLLKQGFGIRDSWCDDRKPRREINAMLAELRKSTASTIVDPAYLGVAVQHLIAVGVGQGHVPGAGLLDIAEHVGGNDWQDRRIDATSETERLFAELAPADRSEAGISASLRRSGAWPMRENFAESWFEESPQIGRLSRGKTQDPAQAVLAGEMEAHRGVWAERFLLMALWARAAKEKATNGLGRDFVILAHRLLNDTKLTDIPLMVGMAERSIVFARARR